MNVNAVTTHMFFYRSQIARCAPFEPVVLSEFADAAGHESRLVLQQMGVGSGIVAREGINIDVFIDLVLAVQHGHRVR